MTKSKLRTNRLSEAQRRMGVRGSRHFICCSRRALLYSTSHELRRGYSTLATVAGSATTPPALAGDSPAGGRQHGVRGRTR